MDAVPKEHRNVRAKWPVAVPSAQDVFWYLAFAGAYFAAYRYGMVFSHTTSSPFWFPDSVLLCALLKSRPRNWWLLVATTLPIRLFTSVAQDTPQWFLLGSFAIDSVKSLVSAMILRRLVVDPLRPKTIRDVIVFVVFAVLLIPGLSALGGAGLRYADGYSYWPSFERWIWGDVLAQLVVTPFILYWVFDAPWRSWKFGTWRDAETAVVFVGLVWTGYLAANTDASTLYFSDARFYAPVPFLFWAAIRFGMAGAAGAVAIVSVFMIEAAIDGRGPFVGQSAAETARALQNFLLLRSAPLYLIAIQIEQAQAMAGTLRESEERFRKMAHSAPMMLWMSDAEEKAVFLNAVWLKFTGRTLAQELGTGWTEGVHPQDIGCSLERCRAAVDAREPFEMEYRLRRHDGEYCWILNKAAPRYGVDGEFAGYIGTAIDITAIKRAEETNRALARTHRLAVMGELTAAIAHEIRQPLSAISLDAQTAEMLANSEKPSLPELREIVSDIRQNVVRADSVIGGIKVFLGKSAAHIDKVDLNAVASEVLWLLSGDAVRRTVRIRSDLGEDLPPVLGDHTQLQQVLLNLVLNGMEAMESVPEPERLLTLQTRRNGDHVEVSVSDRGPGVSADDLPRIFETFFTSKDGGMGMGLSIARSIVAAHKGRIWVEDNPRGGARFYFAVPAAKDSG